jgi:hypothetical protein
MFQYALNDAKSVLYLFLLFLGLFNYILGYECEDKNCKEFFEEIIHKYFENRENLSKVMTMLDLNEVGFIFVEISLRCTELIKVKLKESYKKIYIALKN